MQPKKSLGQNFLRDKNILKKIIQSADLKSDDFVIEIGPGEGALSKELVKRVGRLIAIEKDEDLAKKTAQNFQFSIFNPAKAGSISNDLILNFENGGAIIEGDILKINLPKLIEQNNFQKYKIVANIPYYITSPIIRLFLETKYPPTEMILMVQKEVAERICARPGKMSILALSVQYYAKPEFLFAVPRSAFWPAPEVDSAVIKISKIISPPEKKNPEKKAEAKVFFRVVKAGFSAKRKTLVNNLSNSLHLDKTIAENILKESGLSLGVRAQELSLEDWERLALQSNLFLSGPKNNLD